MLELSLVFLTGLLASIHCVSMCGGFVAAYSLRLGGTDGVMGGGGLHASIIWSHLFYNSGRLITYTLLGGIMGLIGSFIAASGELMGIQEWRRL